MRNADLSPTAAVAAVATRFVQGSTLWDNLKKVAMASFAMKATERDPDFVDNFYAVSVGVVWGGGYRQFQRLGSFKGTCIEGQHRGACTWL
jgi:hypothetical protein